MPLDEVAQGSPTLTASDLPKESAPGFRAPLRCLELFAGAGGLAWGGCEAGLSHVALIEQDPAACIAMTALLGPNHSKHIINSRVENVDLSEFGPVDILSGGPPCQPFSFGGARAGEEDARNMIPLFIDAMALLTPKAFIMENVKGLSSSKFKSYLDYICIALSKPSLRRRKGESWLAHNSRLSAYQEAARYKVSAAVLNAADYGVPQLRERLFIVGTRADQNEFRFPPPTHSATSLMRQQSIGQYWARHNIAPQIIKHKKRYDASCAIDQPWITTRDLLSKFTPFNPKDPMDTEIPGARSYHGHKGSELDWPAKTIKAGQHGVPGGENMLVAASGLRYFTMRELARLQTIPESIIFRGNRTQITRLLGNMVPLNLSKKLMAGLAHCLRDLP